MSEAPVTDRASSADATPGLPAYERLADEIWRRIDSGELNPGQRLPSEEALASESGVSRSTVREALRILERDGCVERASPRIMVVADNGANPTSNQWQRILRRHSVTFEQLSQALRAIDGELVRLAVKQADEKDIASLHEVLARQQEAYEDLSEWSRLDIEFHMRIARISRNPLLILVREASSELLLPLLHLHVSSREVAENSTAYHHRIVDAVEVRDSETAVALMRRHIDDWTTSWEKRGLNIHHQVVDLNLPAD